MPAALTIRAARACERAELEALQLAASLANDTDRVALLAHPDAVELPAEQIEAGQVFVGALDGRTIGFAVVLPREDGDAELDGLFVEPGLWRRGIGRALLEHGCQHACEAGARALHVVAHPEAEGFYLACGFERTGACETRFGPALLMRKALRRR